MMIRASLLVVPLLILALISGCGGGGVTQNSTPINTAVYYPMTEGSTWTYQTSGTESGWGAGLILMKAVAPVEIGGQTAYGVARYHPEGDYNPAYWSIDYMASDASGVRIAGGQWIYDDPTKPPTDVKAYPNGQVVLPSVVSRGTEWTTETGSGSTITVWRCRITDTNRAVTVPAGVFTGCIRVVMEPDYEWTEVMRRTIDYAPGVGMVREEGYTTLPPPPARHTDPGWSSVTELVSYHIAE